MEKYFVYFGCGAASWIPCDSIFEALKIRDQFASRCNQSVKDWHIIQNFSGNWFDII